MKLSIPPICQYFISSGPNEHQVGDSGFDLQAALRQPPRPTIPSGRPHSVSELPSRRRALLQSPFDDARLIGRTLDMAQTLGDHDLIPRRHLNLLLESVVDMIDTAHDRITEGEHLTACYDIQLLYDNLKVIPSECDSPALDVSHILQRRFMDGALASEVLANLKPEQIVSERRIRTARMSVLGGMAASEAIVENGIADGDEASVVRRFAVDHSVSRGISFNEALAIHNAGAEPWVEEGRSHFALAAMRDGGDPATVFCDAGIDNMSEAAYSIKLSILEEQADGMTSAQKIEAIGLMELGSADRVIDAKFQYAFQEIRRGTPPDRALAELEVLSGTSPEESWSIRVIADLTSGQSAPDIFKKYGIVDISDMHALRRIAVEISVRLGMHAADALKFHGVTNEFD